MKKKSLKTLKNKRWKLFSEYIRRKYADRDGYAECVTCKRVKHFKQLQAGHFVPGRTNSILFEEDNCHPQCYGCNVGKYGNTVEYYVFMLEKYGQKRIDELRRIGTYTVKFTIEDHEEAIEELKDKLTVLDCKE